MKKLEVSKWFPKVISIMLIANIILTVINLYVFFQFNQTLTNLGFHNRTLNSTFVIMVEADKVILEKPSVYFVESDVLKYTVHFGKLQVTVHAIMPHYGAVTIKLKSFNVTDSKYIDVNKLDEIEISYADEPQSYVYVLAPGLNQISSQIRLKAKIPINSENFPPYGESIQFLLGYLFLKAEAFDFETGNKMVSEFSSEVFVTIELA